MYDEKIADYRKSKEDLEINLNHNIVNFKMKEDELDTLLMVLEGILVNYFFLSFRVIKKINMIIICRDYQMIVENRLKNMLENLKNGDKFKNS